VILFWVDATAVQDKLDQMVFLWQDVQTLQEEREAKLLDVMDLADKFWCEHSALLVTTKDSQDLLKDLEEPGVDPSVVKQQLEFVEVRKGDRLKCRTHTHTLFWAGGRPFLWRASSAAQHFDT